MDRPLRRLRRVAAPRQAYPARESVEGDRPRRGDPGVDPDLLAKGPSDDGAALEGERRHRCRRLRALGSARYSDSRMATLAFRCGAFVGSTLREKIRIDASITASRTISFHGFASGICLSTSSHAAKTTKGPIQAIVPSARSVVDGCETAAAPASVSVIAAEYSTARRAAALSCPRCNSALSPPPSLRPSLGATFVACRRDGTAARHALDPLTTGEIDRVRDVLGSHALIGGSRRVSTVDLLEPPKADVCAAQSGREKRSSCSTTRRGTRRARPSSTSTSERLNARATSRASSRASTVSMPTRPRRSRARTKRGGARLPAEVCRRTTSPSWRGPRATSGGATKTRRAVVSCAR